MDEVDSMCLDKARHVLYLSHEIECLKWLESLFIMIWAAVLRVNIEQLGKIEQHVADIGKFMRDAIGPNGSIDVPKYLHAYVSSKLDRWVESGFQARSMHENDHFIVDVNKGEGVDGKVSSRDRKIIVVDKDTGVEQYSTKWSNGLAQFLELKYRRKLSVESLKAVFMSNKTFFQRYGPSLYGLTGTLGSENSRGFLSHTYRVNFADIPTSMSKRFAMLPSVVEFEYAEWLESVAREVRKQTNSQRPVLVICENLDVSNQVYGELISQGVAPNSIVKYARDGDNVEERFKVHLKKHYSSLNYH